ncbi:MAG: hypothetical protein E7536_08950 [Ruminococcaceae bacterium]|nr:hypothetical protein [Oscillospiraceae bacterium]
MIKKKFYIINKENRTKQIETVLDILFPKYKERSENKFSDYENFGQYFISKEIAEFILNRITEETYTIVIEEYNVNNNYRDSYNSVFSGKHFQVDRFCIRVSLFVGEVDNIFWFIDKNKQKILKGRIIGFFVISPLEISHIVKALIQPRYLTSDKIYMRLSEYTCHIYGVEFKIKAFPYQMQDTETTRCAEATILNIMDYYANTYPEYKVVLPSDILELEKKYCHERVLPPHGITYSVLTKILYELGFSPRLYNRRTMHNHSLTSVTQNDEMKRLLYYYVESGMIVGVNVEPEDLRKSGHSLLCIGHGKEKDKEKAYENSEILISENQKRINIINSADFYKNFVVIDDNQIPYAIRSFDKLSLHDNMSVSNIAVPLYKKMFLEASDAYDIAMRLLKYKKTGLFVRAKEYLDKLKSKNIITRLFLASSNSYKIFKTEENDEQSMEFKYFYSSILLLPQFVWVCELYSEEGYERGYAFGEIIIDASSSAKNGIQSVISLNYPSGINFRNPSDSIEQINENFYPHQDKWCEFKGYEKNLTPIKDDEKNDDEKVDKIK